ncbi:hypothetical protein BH11BAC3_BH11BAC3_13250 [soil metagenome]
MKYLIKIIIPIFVLFCSAGCKKVDDANQKFPKIVPDFTSSFDSTTGTATFVSTSKNGTNYFWNFGDNFTSTQQNPVHTYTKNGKYSVVLTVSNSAGATDSIAKNIDINILVPIVLLPVSLPITFDAITVGYANNFISTSLPVTLITNPQLTGSNSAATKVASITNAGVAGENFGVKLNPGVDISTQKSFTIDVYSSVAIPVKLQLDGGTAPNPQSTQTHDGSGWKTLTFTVSGTGVYTNFYLYFGSGTTAGTFYIDNIMQVATVAPVEPTTAAPTPPQSQANVLSIYSDKYTTVGSPNYNPGWGQTTVQSELTIGSDHILKYANFNYQGTDFTSQNLSAYNFIHIDVWTANATDLKFTPIGGGETLLGLTPLNIGQWNSYDIPLSSFTAVNLATVNQLKFDGQGGVNPSTIFVDNIYFYKTSSTPPPFDGGLIINGDFQAATSAPWTIGVSTTLAPTVTVSGNTYYSVNVTAAGNSYDVNLSQQLNITQGKMYTLTFDAWSDVNRPIVAGIGLSGGSFANDAKTQNITTTRTTYTLTLSAATFGAADARVLFDLGAAVGVVNIDNVSLVEVPSGGGGGGGGASGCTGTLVAATALPVDFESCQTFLTSNNFGAGITSMLVANPDKSGINTSNYVLQVDKPTGSEFYAGIQNPFASDLDLTKPFKMKIYSKKAGVVFNIGVNNSPDKPGVGLPGPQYVTVTTANVWTLVTIQFTGLPPGATANQIYIKPDNPVGDPAVTAGSTYYIDDITQ